MRVYLCACKTKELVSINNIYQLYIFLCDIYCITILFFYCSKVQYLVDILIKAKALVLNRNYISTQSVMQMKKKSYIKFYFSFIYNYLNWLSYIHRKKKFIKRIIIIINIMCALSFARKALAALNIFVFRIFK